MLAGLHPLVHHHILITGVHAVKMTTFFPLMFVELAQRGGKDQPYSTNFFFFLPISLVRKNLLAEITTKNE